MKKFFKRHIFHVFIFIFHFCLFNPTLLFAIEDTIIAVVNDDVITLKDFRDYLNSIYAQLKVEGKNPNTIKKVMQDLEKNGLTKLIEDKLIISAANDIGLEIREDVVDQRLEEIKKRYNSEQEFLNALLSDGATVTDLRNKITDQLKVKYFIDMEVRSKIYVNPQEVTDFYKKHFEKYYKAERLKLESIYISNGEDTDLAREKITNVYNLLTKFQKEGKSFAELAEEYSETPSIGIVEKGHLLTSIEKEVFQLKVGEVSSIVEVEGGLYIFRVKEKFPSYIPALEEVKDEVYNELFYLKFKEKFEDWIKKLKENAFIEIKE